MAADAETFDSGDEETPEEKKRTPEERKQIFRRELAAMLFGFGDAKEPRADTLEQLETVVLAYVQQLCQRALHVGKAGRLGLEDVYYFIRRDPKKYARVRELLSLSEELKRARKPFEQMKELTD
ncbi:Transcription initiation factor IID, subunit [Aphelenchoides fujianensis]|nr:Transcription initiation factor IID, subunit [Aphelenchoides fujianensis]